MRVNTFFLLIASALMIRNSLALVSMHFKCRARVYPRSTIERYPVPDDKVSWSVEYKHYNPPNYTAPSVHGKPWADPPIDTPNFQPKWNNIDGKISRVSYTGKYEIVDGYPRNPIGRTGLIGRGVLGRWGPNHAADPVVTRWKRINPETIDLENHVPRSNKPILQFVAIKRGDTGEWALPGGMVDPGEKVTATAVREFQEEATNSLKKSNEEKESWQKRFEEFFKGGDEVFRGYVDDPRNTDNAWMETAAYNFHDESGAVVGGLELHAGDDAVGARWVDITPDLNLYASHKDIVLAVLQRHTR